MLVFKKEGVDYNLEFPNRCFFCFVDVSSNEGDIRHQLQYPVDKFQKVFNHLETKHDNDSVKFIKTPPICDTCGPIVNHLHFALQQLTSATLAVKSRIKNFGPDEFNREERLQTFMINLINVVPKLGSVQEALKLLEEIGHGPFPEISVVSSPSTSAEPRIQSQALNKSERHEINNGATGESACINLGEDLEYSLKAEEEIASEIELQQDGANDEDESDYCAEENDVDMEEKLIPDYPDSDQKLEEVDPLSDFPSSGKRPAVRSPPRNRRSRAFKRPKMLVSRGEEEDDKMEEDLCGFCGDRVAVRNMLEHARGHVGGYVVPCPNPDCQYVFSSLRSLNSHVLSKLKCSGFQRNDCDICGMTGMTMGSLSEHLQRRHETLAKHFPCPVSGCPERFTHRQSVFCHINVHATAKTAKKRQQFCDFCRQKVSLVRMEEHMRGHVGDFALPCPNPTCGHYFSRLNKWNQHINDTRACLPFLDKDIHTCDLCGHKATSNLSLRGHLKVVHETAEKPFPCPVSGCLHRFTHRQTVQCHIVQHSPPSNVGVKPAPPSFQACPTCQVHLLQDEIRGHLEKIHGDLPDSIISCQHCRDLFPSREKLLDHWLAHLKSGIPVSCDLCNDDHKFLNMRSLRFHFRTRHQIGGLRVLCEQCNKWFAQGRSFEAHLRQFHSGIEKAPPESFKCVECPGQEFKAERDLMSHNIKYHGADPFKCQFCGKEFDKWSNLCTHENEHKGVASKVWTCDVAGCGRTFKQKKGLDCHKRSVEHAGITNAFICGDCGKGFNHDGSLKQHKRIVHGSERKFVCEECGESFKLGNVLRRHKMIHTGEKPFLCDICQQRFRHKEVLQRHIQGHEKKGASFKPKGPMKNLRKRVKPQI